MDCNPDSRRPHPLGQEGSLLQNNPGGLVSGGRGRCLVVAGESCAESEEGQQLSLPHSSFEPC